MKIINKNTKKENDLGFKCNANRIVEKNFYNAQTKLQTKLNPEDLPNKIENGLTVIFGGHYFIEPEKPTYVSKSAQETYKTACKTVRKLKEKGIDAYVNLMMNDIILPVPKEDYGKTRKRIRQGYELPQVLEKILFENDLTKEDVWKTCWAKTLVNRFQDKRNYSFRKTFSNLVNENFNGPITEIKYGEGEACIKAITQYALDLNRSGVKNLVMIIPGCSLTKVKKAFDVTKKAIPELNVYALFQTGNCYE